MARYPCVTTTVQVIIVVVSAATAGPYESTEIYRHDEEKYDDDEGAKMCFQLA